MASVGVSRDRRVIRSPRSRRGYLRRPSVGPVASVGLLPDPARRSGFASGRSRRRRLQACRPASPSRQIARTSTSQRAAAHATAPMRTIVATVTHTSNGHPIALLASWIKQLRPRPSTGAGVALSDSRHAAFASSVCSATRSTASCVPPSRRRDSWARRKNSGASCSQVAPMPPCTLIMARAA